MKAAALAAGVAAFGGATQVWASSSDTPALDKDTLVVGLDKGFANLNAVVAVTSDSDRYTLLVFDRLFAFDKIGNLQPSLATSVEISPDGLAYTYRLREGVRFHDGSALTADDVKFTMAFALDPLTKSSRQAFFAPYVEGIDVLDPLTVVSGSRALTARSRTSWQATCRSSRATTARSNLRLSSSPAPPWPLAPIGSDRSAPMARNWTGAIRGLLGQTPRDPPYCLSHHQR